jgi:hypothetical protein
MNGKIKTLLCIVFLATGISAQRSFVMDDCEDGDPRSIRGGWWYTYDDKGTGGNSYVTPPPYGFKMSGPGCGTTGYAAHMKGTAGDKLGWDYIGMGVNIADTCACPAAKPVDMKEYTKIRFKMKGSVSGGRLTMLFPYTENKCKSSADSPASLTEWADYEAPLTAKLTPDWTVVELDLRKDFRQPRWAKQTAIVPMVKVLENLKNVNFHFQSPDGDSIDLWVDDVEFVK